MLIAFRFENYSCFRDPVELSLVATAGKQAEENIMTVPVISRRGTQDLRLLRSIAIQGANASGKSTLCDAFYMFCSVALGLQRRFLPDVSLPLPLTPFLRPFGSF